MRLGRSLTAAFAAAIVTTLVACGSPSYEYVRNTEARTAFKVPIDWTVFDEATFRASPRVLPSTPRIPSSG